MSDTAIAIAVVPLLVALTVLLECTRVGCAWLSRKIRAPRNIALHGTERTRSS